MLLWPTLRCWEGVRVKPHCKEHSYHGHNSWPSQPRPDSTWLHTRKIPRIQCQRPWGEADSPRQPYNTDGIGCAGEDISHSPDLHTRMSLPEAQWNQGSSKIPCQSRPRPSGLQEGGLKQFWGLWCCQEAKLKSGEFLNKLLAWL